MDDLWKKLGLATFIGNKTLEHVTSYMKRAKNASDNNVPFVKDDTLDSDLDNEV